MNDYTIFKCNHFTEIDRNNPDEREAVAYADVDGYTTNEEQPGTVICRIWMMRDRYTNSVYDKFKYLVDWHLDAYRTNKEVQDVIKQGKEDLKKYFVDVVVERVFKSSYRKYKVRWMADNGHPLEELMAKVQEQFIKNVGKVDTEYAVMKAFEQFEKNGCFGDNLLWSNPELFRIEEWENEDYMRELLTAEEFSIWKDQ